jgi:hypothetical protein
VGLTIPPPSWADSLKSGSLNLLQHAGRVHACHGIVLPFITIYKLASPNRCLCWELHKTYEFTLRAEKRIFEY